jgi:hypothetical protein
MRTRISSICSIRVVVIPVPLRSLRSDESRNESLKNKFGPAEARQIQDRACIAATVLMA